MKKILINNEEELDTIVLVNSLYYLNDAPSEYPCLNELNVGCFVYINDFKK